MGKEHDLNQTSMLIFRGVYRLGGSPCPQLPDFRVEIGELSHNLPRLFMILQHVHVFISANKYISDKIAQLLTRMFFQNISVCRSFLRFPALNKTWKARCPIFKAKVAGFRGKVASKIGHLAFQASRFNNLWRVIMQFGRRSMLPLTRRSHKR